MNSLQIYSQIENSIRLLLTNQEYSVLVEIWYTVLSDEPAPEKVGNEISFRKKLRAYP